MTLLMLFSSHICKSLVFFSAPVLTWATTAQAREPNCEDVGQRVISITSGASAMSNIEALVTWRASCSDNPPVGEGKVITLCEGDLISKSGNPRRFFHWAKTTFEEKVRIGFYVCP
jgi:hypothetical protein